jgi:2-oxoisovalerate dehydrogenase E1 component
MTELLSGPVTELLDQHRRMAVIRVFEETTATLYAAGEIPGFVHLSVGQEAVPVGVCSALRDDDVITSTHRGHGHVLAKGLDPAPMMAELMGRATGTCGGFGGSMHIADPALGVFGANGIVGAGVPIAGGAAFAARLHGKGQVVAAFFGDGAVATGAWHEATTLAALWRLPLLLEAVTERVRGHYEGDPQRYRDGDSPSATDPLERSRTRLLLGGVGEDRLAEIHADVARIVHEAVEAARSAPEPSAERMHELGDVRRVLARTATSTKPRPAAPDTTAGGSGEQTRGSRAVRAALRDALADDPRVVLAGIDVAAGNVFGLTRGLAESFPGRVFDTPIAESAIMGLGVGAAMAGLRPVVELMYLDFLGVCLDQLMNQAAKLPFMTGGTAEVGMVVRTQFGVGRSSGSQHSQGLEAMLAHVPGLVVVAPATPEDMYGLLRSAIDLPAPVVVIENRLLYERPGPGPAPAPGHRTPLGVARVARTGRDVTVVTLSRALHTVLAAAELAAAQGIDCEVVDLRTVAPLDHDTVLGSLARTNRLLVVTESVTDFGIGAEIAARAADQGFWSLDAPARRVSGPPTPVPYNPTLEQAWVPTVQRVLTEIVELTRDR